MKPSHFLSAGLLAPLAAAHRHGRISPDKVEADIQTDQLHNALKALDKIAQDSDGNRAFGLPGYNSSIDFILEHMEGDLSDHFDTVVQPFTHLFSITRSISLTGPEGDIEVISLQYNHATPLPYGVTAPLVALPVDDERGTGCFEDQWTQDVSEKIVLIKRGKCHFATPLKFAKDKGALAVVIWNNDPSQKAGSASLGAENSGKLAPVGVVSYDQGMAWKKRLDANETFEVNLTIDELTEERETWQVISESKEGDPDNVILLGAHLDSVQAGPGINDNGSGVVALLEIARSFSKYTFKNKVRFAWWGAEESGMIGSAYYASHLSDKDADRIRFYYNYDMVASPQPVYTVYADSDGDKAGAVFLYDYLVDQGYPAEYAPFGKSSDYVAFLELGIPSSGIFTGAGSPADSCYHTSCDGIENVNLDTLVVNTKAAARGAAELALCVDGIPPRGQS